MTATIANRMEDYGRKVSHEVGYSQGAHFVLETEDDMDVIRSELRIIGDYSAMFVIVGTRARQRANCL